jgi:transposase-like protein
VPQSALTKDTISETAALKALLSETADHQILAGMPGFVADRLMAPDVDQLCGAGSHERSVERMNHRNGYRPRRRETRAGAVDVQIPKPRKGTYFPEFPEPRRASEKAMTAVIQEADIQGVSTRSVDDLVKAMHCPAGDCEAICRERA